MAGPVRIAMVAGESSGDALGASLLRSMKDSCPDLEAFGVGGPRMAAEGFASRVDLDRLAVNGFVDPIKRLPFFIGLIRELRAELTAEPPDAFVGVDYNFFNLLLAGMLKKAGIPTVHYVSPSVWAWRARRIHKIARAVDLMLTLYPFETAIYEANGIDVCFVGHPKADEIPLSSRGGTSRDAARRELGYEGGDLVIAILPGSRGSEVRYSGESFFRAAKLVMDRHPRVRFVVPSANEARRVQIEALLAQLELGLDAKVVDNEALRAMTAADVVLVNSGTATLEAMLLKRPMVMSYRLGALTYGIVSRLVTTEFFALPNILAGRQLVPELLQDAATPEALSAAVLTLLTEDTGALTDEFERIHGVLRRDAGARAAEAVLALIEARRADHGE